MLACTAKELAAALRCDISTVHRRAAAEHWPFEAKPGRGGGKLFPSATLPKDVRASLTPVMLHTSAPVRVKAQGKPTATITQRQRECMEARLVFVREIERLAALSGKETAIRHLVKESRRETLPEHLQDLVHVACARPGTSGRRGLSRRRLYEWCTLFDRGGASALVPGQRQKDMTPPPWAQAFLELYQTPQKPSVEDCLRRLQVPGLRPSRDAVYRFLRKMGMPARETGRATGNAILALRPHHLRTTDHLMPGDVYTADGTTFDAEIQHPANGRPFKPEITAVLDVATRRCVGISVGLAESALTILDALRMSCCYAGIPAMFYTDNGPGYKNQLLGLPGQGMLARLGIEMTNSIPGRPRGKGLMERAVQTLFVPLAKRLPSCTHADMDRDAGKKIFKITRADIKQHGASPLLPTWKNFLHQLAARVDEYNGTPHRALPKITDVNGRRRHMAPNEMWQRFLDDGWEPFMVPESVRPDLFMPGEVRKVRNGAVRIFGESYYSSELTEFHGDLVEVRYDIWNPDEVQIWTTRGEKICPAAREGNALPYFPQSRIDAARERRAKGQVARLAGKLAAIVPGATVQLPEPDSYEVLTIADSIQPEKPGQPEAAEQPAPRPLDIQRADDRPIFQHPYEKYEWLMRHRDQWTGADVDWLNDYTSGESYADLRDHYQALGLAWSEARADKSEAAN